MAGRRVLGVDPGSKTGGLVLRVDGVVAMAGCWTKVAKGWRMRLWCPGARRMVDEVTWTTIGGAFAWAVDDWTIDVAVVEGLEPPRRKITRRAVKDLLTLAESTGAVVDRVALVAPVVLRPTATTWREVIGAARLDGDRAEDCAIEVARREGWLLDLPDWTAAEQGAVAEAAAMAVWGASHG